MLPVSKDTLLRVVRRPSHPPAGPLRVIGIDDWAWRRNHRYASIICNLERRRVVTLLPDREPATAQAWAHPTSQSSPAIVAGDMAKQQQRPCRTVQVADRWHLMENASRAFLDSVRKSMRQIRIVIGATTIGPKLLTAAERLQYEGYLRREETNAATLTLSNNGYLSSRACVKPAIAGSWCDRWSAANVTTTSEPGKVRWICTCRGSTINGRPAAANGAELWRRLAARGFRGSLRVISEWATRRRQAEKADARNLQRIPSARTIARLMTIGRDLLTKAETVTVAAIEAGVPTLVEAREIIAEFHLMIRRKTEAGLIPWIERAHASLVASFANGVAKDEPAAVTPLRRTGRRPPH
ncbi:transposase [Bradyrhizobium sp. 159]|uniref:transposase n=1 Tax=Bradyrhizobium sp. 159 TaxID=2782632 RepID=UPI001FFC281A|nr:transposase [Bradyrhizobium sp. 159]MCK1618229.1 transposase [Bradyrhizobium sp. 159]